MTAVINGAGTDEAVWRPWLQAGAWPALDRSSLRGRRVVALAAHPDDEVLGVGGLLSHLAQNGTEIVCVWATDGEASHPGSTVYSRSELAMLRRDESRAALDQLGVTPSRSVHLGLPDSGVSRHMDELTECLVNIVEADDVLLAPWQGDGHPDHEAVGVAASRINQTLIEYPIWMWHWAVPGDSRVPWHRLRSVNDVDLVAKTAAIDAFATQVRPVGPDEADAAILPPHVVARFVRAAELVFQ